MKKIKVLTLALIPVLAISVLMPGWALAGGWGNNQISPDQIASRFTDMFNQQAGWLGISADEIKNGWAEGKTLNQMAGEHGITQDQLRQKIQDARLVSLKSELQVLVDKGVITQTQADRRLANQQDNTNKRTAGGHGMMFGLGRHHGFDQRQ